MVRPKLIEIWKRTGRSEEWIQNKIAELTPTAEPVGEHAEVASTPQEDVLTKTAKATRRRKKRMKIKLSFWLDNKTFEQLENLMNQSEIKNKSKFLREVFKEGLEKRKQK